MVKVFTLFLMEKNSLKRRCKVLIFSVRVRNKLKKKMDYRHFKPAVFAVIFVTSLLLLQAPAAKAEINTRI